MDTFLYILAFVCQLAMAFLLGRIWEIDRSMKRLRVWKELNDEIFSIAVEFRNKFLEERMKNEALTKQQPTFRKRPIKK